MIPTWNPKPEFLKEAIDSVLMQDLGNENMQIAVVDDCSTEIDVELQLKNWGYLDRIEYYQNQTQRGIGGNWNVCIDKNRGEWIHILHQDDMVLDGLYRSFTKSLYENKEISIFINRTIYITMNGLWKTFSRIAADESGIIDDLITFVHNLDLQCPGIIVRANVYVETGNFREDLNYSLDRLKWTEIISKYKCWYEPQPYNCFRLNKNSQSERLKVNGSNIIEYLNTIDDICSFLPANIRPIVKKEIKKRVTASIFDMPDSKFKAELKKEGWLRGNKLTWLKKAIIK